MAGKLKIFAYVTVLLAVMLVSVGCGDDLAELDISADTYSYTPKLDIFNESKENEVILETSETTKAPETTKTTEIATPSQPTTGTVYWVSSGEVWHVTEKCSTLSRSKNIKSGSVSDAMAVGKARVCQRCGG